jgi:DNA-binding LacI/PurR family transcriptional regulator
MPPHKADLIARILRAEILAGGRAPGAKLPTYDALMERFQVSRPTVSRVLDALREEGLVNEKGAREVCVAEHLPHQERYLWVTSERPGSREWTGFLAAFLDLIERGETGIAGQVVPLVGVDGRANNPAYRLLCEIVAQGSTAGLLLMNSATVYQLPVLEKPDLPRAAIWAPLPHAGLVALAFDALLERACARLLESGGRLAVISPHEPHLQAARAYLSAGGLPESRLWPLHVAGVSCERVTELLFDRRDRPDAVFVTDDNLIEPLLRGLLRAKLEPARDVYVLAHGNFPRPIGLGRGVEHIGFDVREIFLAAKACIDAQRAGETAPTRTVHPRFADELLQPLLAPISQGPSQPRQSAQTS